MKKTLRGLVSGKSVAILGFGREGRSTYEYLVDEDVSGLAVLDLNQVEVEKKNCKVSVEVVCGRDYQKRLNSYDIVFKSPGIVLEENIENLTCTIISQMDVFFMAYSEKIIGITGTKGKSTTTTLMYHVLKEAGMDVLIAGNIGIPVFDVAKDVKEDTKIVVELSCHQLEYAVRAPHIGVLLNIHEEHLDHYKTMDRYRAAKENIYKNQKDGDILFCEESLAPDECIATVLTAGAAGLTSKESADIYTDGRIIRINSKFLGIREFVIPQNIKLMGIHNFYDMSYVYAIASYMGVGDDVIGEAFQTYEPLPHRLQKVATVNGVTYYDDSISTIDETTIQALNTLKDAGSVIVGGMDRGISYKALEYYLAGSFTGYIILMEETGRRVYAEIKESHRELFESGRLILTEHLEDAVKMGAAVTPKGKSCVMSPAAASYGIFKNFEDRGRAFKEYVMSIPRDE